MPGLFYSTEKPGSENALAGCDISQVAEISFGSTQSSDDAPLKEALDRSEACQDFEHPDLAI